METLQILSEIKEKQIEIATKQAELALQINQLLLLMTPPTTPPPNPPGSGN